MTLLHRRIIYLSFIGIFLVSAPLIILYTMGYRYDLAKGRVQKTGIIRITSVPRGADIFLNGAKYDLSQTPAKIEKLLPGDYEIKLSKNGYYEWQKKLPVYENGTTFAEKVILWKKSDKIILATTSASSWLTAPDNNSVAFVSNRNIVNHLNISSGIFGELSGGDLEIIVKLANSDTAELISFSPSGRYLLAKTQKSNKFNYQLIDTQNKSAVKIVDQDYSIVKWEASSDNLYALNKAGLWNINPTSLNAELIAKGLSATDFYIADKTLYSISADTLKRQNLGETDSSLIEKLDCPNCLIREIKSNRLIALSDSGDLSIVDLNRQTKTIKAKADQLDWLNPRSLIFYNDFEIYIYDLTKNDPELITRLGSPITSAVWHPNGRHLLFSTDDQIKIIELDNRELRNIISIADSSAGWLAVDRAGNNLFFSSASGINKLVLQ